MTVTQTIAVFALLPVVIVAAISAIVYLPAMMKARRYRPGTSFDFTPVWFGARQHYQPERYPVGSYKHGDKGGISASW